jgi:hypothetical protein
MRRLESLARTADVTIFWGFGDNETTDTNALADLHEAARRSKRLAIVKVDDTHAKVLVSDAYYTQPTAAPPASPAATAAVPGLRWPRRACRPPPAGAGPPRSRDEIRKDALRKITAGQTMSGVIKNVTNFGAFVNLGDDVTGLIHISQLSTKRLGHPTEVINVDDSVMVTVLKVDVDAERVSLKLKTENRTRRS